jgi:LysR family hydrogen peroxide-inducible transcriptional activator
MQSLPTLRQLQYLLALHKVKNFRQAAENCHITQPTLSAAIKEMENLLGADVLDRSRRKSVVFSPLGLEVVETAKKIAPHLESLMEKAKNMSAPLSGPIRLGLIPTIAPYFLPKILPALQKTFPNIEWQIVETMSVPLVEKLNNGQIDLAILAFPYETEGLSQEIFFQEKFICAAPKNTFKAKQILSFKDLDNKKLLLLEDGHCLRDHALSACKLQDKQEEKTFSATSLQTLIQMVDHGYGITLLPEMVIAQSVMPPNVALHKFKAPYPTRSIGAIWRSNDPQKDDLRKIVTLLRQISRKKTVP